MQGSQLNRRVARFLQGIFGRGLAKTQPRTRGSTVHVIIIDGTLSTLSEGCESNAGLAYKLLRSVGAPISVYYEPGIQWSHWRGLGDVLTGKGINRQIKRAYGYLASRYRPGDKIYLLGYSRGAYAVRSLAGVIDQVGLLRAENATQRNVRDVYRHYQGSPDSDSAARFARAYCHAGIEIEMIGVWDTVKSLGLNAPVLWRYSAPKHAFHNAHLGPSVKAGFHAVARDETRVAYSPVMWETDDGWHGEMQQMWFRGSHGDIGGMLDGFEAARPLSNIPLVWILDKAESRGLTLPDGWRARFPQDAAAPSSGTFRGMGKWLMTRRPRNVGRDASERIHPSVAHAPQAESWSSWFWRGVSEAARFSPFRRSPFDILSGKWTLDNSPMFIALDLMARVVSPYDLNPSGLNPLSEILDECIDFDLIDRAPIKLYVTATNVRTGRGRLAGDVRRRGQPCFLPYPRGALP